MVTTSTRRAPATSQPTGTAAGVVDAMNREWRALCARTRRDILATWADHHPALRPFGELDELARAASRRDDHEDALHALLVLAQGGDELAGRTVVQALIGNAVRLAWRTRGHAGGDLEESRARALAALWQVIKEYKLTTRRCRLVDGISLDVLHLLTRPTADTREHSMGSLDDLEDLRPSQVADPDDEASRSNFWAVVGLHRTGLCSDEQLIVLLAWAVREQVLTLPDAHLLLRFYHQGTDAAGQRAAADNLGLGYAAARQRASRAVRRLCNAVHDVLVGAEATSPAA